MPIVEDVSLFEGIRSWLEVLYFASGIIVMVLVGFGLWQLKLTKDQIELAKNQIETSKEIFKTQSKRAAVEAAVIECRKFSETIIQDSVALRKFCTDNSIAYFEDIIFTRTEKGFSVDAKNVKDEDIEKLMGAEAIINSYMNGLESYALFFLSGVADENIAFHSNAKEFINQAEKAFKLFPICEIDGEDLEPVKSLYYMWREKYDAKKLKLEQKKIKEKLSTYKENNIKAIGT